jgi:methylmalonyl-CoA mutase cobalamin-binding subunit
MSNDRVDNTAVSIYCQGQVKKNIDESETNMVDPRSPRYHQPRHPMQVVARATGLSPDVLRAWERRYRAVDPGRTPGAHRLYSDADIVRLTLMRKALAAGRRIGFVARLPMEELELLVAQDEARPGPGPLASRRLISPAPDSSLLARGFAAIERLDGPALERVLTDAGVTLTMPQMLEELLVPLLQEIGTAWRHGRISIRHEHLATAAIRAWLVGARQVQSPPAHAPAIVVATPAGQVHELGALMAALVAESAGWQVVYLGVDLPADEIAAAARQGEARAVALSVIYPPDDPRLPHDLRRLRRLLPGGLALFAGGDAAAAYAGVLREVDARLVESISELREALDALRRQVA